MEKFTMGTIVLVRSKLFRACAPEDSSKVFWDRKPIPSRLCLFLGFTHLRNGQIFPSQVTTDWEGDKDYEPGGIIIESCVKAYVVQPWQDHGRYARSFYTLPEDCSGGFPVIPASERTK